MKTIYLTTNHLNQTCAVQFQYGSTNGKTGDGVQIWILPLEWVVKGTTAMEDDSASCMDCPHSKSAGRSCYVRKANSERGLKSKVRSLHFSYKKGTLDIRHIVEATREVSNCAGKFIRFGAYGEPVLIGESIVRELTTVADEWTGYTHQWYQPAYSWSSKYFMASVETDALQAKAELKGYRTFRVRSKNDEIKAREVSCPASKEAGNKTTCNKCGLCKGTSSQAKSITIIKH